MAMLVEAGIYGWITLVVGLCAIGLAVVHAVRPRRGVALASVVLVAGSAAVGFMGTVVGLIHSFAAVAGVEPSTKAELLARGISESMNCTAFAVGAIPLWLVPFVIGQIRGRRQRIHVAVPPVTSGDTQRPGPGGL